MRVLKNGESTGTARAWGRGALVIGQVAIAVVLLAVATFIYHAFRDELAHGPGYRIDHLLMATFDPTLLHEGNDETRHFYRTLTDGVRAGARQAAVSRTLPDPVTAAKNRVKSSAAGLDGNKLDITVTPLNPADGTATWVQGGDVTVEAKYPFKIKLFGVVVMDGKLKSKTTERVE